MDHGEIRDTKLKMLEDSRFKPDGIFRNET